MIKDKLMRALIVNLLEKTSTNPCAKGSQRLAHYTTYR